MRGQRARSDCQRLAFREERGRRRSWLTAVLSGRLTGSGAPFAGSSNPFNNLPVAINHAGQSVIDQAKKDAQSAAGTVAQNAVTTVSPVATIVTPEMMLAGAVVVGALLFSSE